jgi:hypothetical protein
MKVPLGSIRSVCMTFTYLLLRLDSELSISVEPRNMKQEQVWVVLRKQKDTVWKTGQVWLGLVSEFKVLKYFKTNFKTQ